jgi:hypothetical protein
MKPMFNKYESYNKAGGEFSDKIRSTLEPIMEEWAEKGFRVKDIESIILDNVSLISTFIRSTKAIKMRMKEFE